MGGGYVPFVDVCVYLYIPLTVCSQQKGFEIRNHVGGYYNTGCRDITGEMWVGVSQV